MDEDRRVIKNIEKLGDRYFDEHLKWDTKELENSWWEALRFFFNHSFYRGRRDELSNEYYHFAIDVLERFLQINSVSLDESYEVVWSNAGLFDKNFILRFKRSKNMGKANSIGDDDFDAEVASKNNLIKQFITPKGIVIEWYGQTYLKKVYLGNDEDIMMVLDVLNFISNEKRKNVYRYLKQLIANSGPRKAYFKLTDFRAISDKIATLIIRDIALMNPGLLKCDYKYAFPVDTWVRTIYEKLTHRKMNRIKDEDIKRFFIEKCKGLQIDPLRFAAGLWYLGFNSLDIVLKCLEKVDVENVHTMRHIT